jgi:hypothetical protein
MKTDDSDSGLRDGPGDGDELSVSEEAGPVFPELCLWVTFGSPGAPFLPLHLHREQLQQVFKGPFLVNLPEDLAGESKDLGEKI